MTTRTALFVIDIQNDLTTDPATRIPAADRIRTAGEKILTTARRLQTDNIRDAKSDPPGMIVIVQHEDLPGQGPLKKDTPAWELVFPPETGEYLVQKTTRDTFESNPHLAEMLKRKGVEHIWAFGIQSECCVESTCIGALNAGFRVTLLRGAHSTYDVDGKSAAEVEKEVEHRLEGRGALIEDWEKVVRLWGAMIG
ncbi:Isochorismatase-like protein [Echria macrotheca]|uniref:Isochorismatase-like protein n=1 Tax=Echria macrotheca TaxID=438768 RepID=A0AAJ0B8F4_9PEZI|nr:Isochorismatase-like protein [Echria macrotheca]